MKKFIYLLGIFFLFSSCEKYFGDVNIDPDQPLDVPPSVILGGVEGTLAYAYGGDLTRHASIFTQHLTGVSRQWAVLQNYGIVGEDVNTVWGTNLYAGVLMELKQLKTKSEELGYKHYLGVAQVIEAYTLLLLTDNWNAVPYSEALNGVENLQPAYDSQDAIYDSVFELLNTGRNNLNEADGGALTPGGEDLIFAGDIASWIGFANFIEARAYLHLGAKDAANYQNALDAINAGALTADCAMAFSGGSTSNPMYQFNEQRGDCSIGSTIQTLVNDLNDPRRHLYDHAFDTDHPLLTTDRDVYLGTLAEQKFIEAECTFNISGATAAHPLYLEAIELSMSAYGYADSTAAYVGQAEVDPGDAALTLEHIMTQKYIALFLDPEVFNDWRRTGFPVLTPNTGSSIPVRLPYPQKELNLNPNVPSATINTPVDWDI